MAYPILTDIFRAQVVFQGGSGLGEDVFVNNFYFRNDTLGPFTPGDDYSTIAGVIGDALDDFYTAQTDSDQAVDQFLHGSITGVKYKVYDLGYDVPRYPVVTPEVRAWQPSTLTNAIPGEVALCLSFKSGPGPRQRGRIYLGPMNDAALLGGAWPVRPTIAVQTALGNAAVRMMNDPVGCTWVQVSPTGATSGVINEAWVDNALDTQRSRGVAPTGRLRWDAAGLIT